MFRYHLIFLKQKMNLIRGNSFSGELQNRSQKKKGNRNLFSKNKERAIEHKDLLFNAWPNGSNVLGTLINPKY